MSYINTYKVNSFNEYINVIKKIKRKNNNRLLWFRGQSNSNYRLEPSILRNAYVVKNKFHENIEPRPVSYDNSGEIVYYPSTINMLNEFKKIAEKHLRVAPRNDFEWLFVAQHYGVPTILLDWTTDPLVSLFFSLPKEFQGSSIIKEYNKSSNIFEKYRRSNMEAAIFVLDPCEFNKWSEFYYTKDKNVLNKPINIADNFDIFKGYIYPNEDDFHLTPLCVLSNPIDYRICRQSGNFTIHSTNVWPLDFYEVYLKCMYKINIPYKCLYNIKEYLEVLDITKESIYGNDTYLDGQVLETKDKELENFYNEIYKLKKKYKK